MEATGQIPRRQFGKTGVEISALALGGHHLGDADDYRTAKRIVDRVLDGGITFLTTAGSITGGKVKFGWARR